MTPEAKKQLDEFFSDDSYRYHKPRVAEIVGGDVKDMTNWGLGRDLLLFPPEKIGTKLMLTRNGLLTFGIMSELAWLIGPENASAAAKEIWEDLLARSPHGFDFEELMNLTVTFKKPVVYLIDLPRTPRFPKPDEGEWQRVAGFTMHYATREELEREPVPYRTTVILPIGQLFCTWGHRAMALEVSA